MCNTPEENAADLMHEASIPTVDITREALIDKLVDFRADNFDREDIVDAVRYGRDGYEEYTNGELEQQAMDYMLVDDEGNEVRYRIIDADTCKPSGRANANLVTACEALVGVAQWAIDHGVNREAIEAMIAMAQGAIGQAQQAGH